MTPNLEVLRTEIPEFLQSRSLVMFRSSGRRHEGEIVDWDTERHTDYQAFIAVAEQLGAKVIVYRDQEFHESMVDAAIEDLEDSELSYEDRREYEHRLREYRNYSGFTCLIQMTFTHDRTLYAFELSTDWFQEFQTLAGELEAILDESDAGDEEPPLGGYFSRN